MSTNNLIMEELHFVKGIDPVADHANGTATSDVVNMANYDRVLWLVYKGVGAVGTTTIKVLACLDTTPSASQAMPFHYRQIATGDTEGEITTGTAAAGFLTTQASSEMYLIEVDAAAVLAQGSLGYHYAQLQMTEVNGDPVFGCVLSMMGDVRYGTGVKPGATT